MLDLKTKGLEIADLCERSSLFVDEIADCVRVKGRALSSLQKLVCEDYFEISIAEQGLSVNALMGSKVQEQDCLNQELVLSGLHLSRLALKLYEQHADVFFGRYRASRVRGGTLSSDFCISAHQEHQEDILSFLSSVKNFQVLANHCLSYLIDNDDLPGISNDLIDRRCVSEADSLLAQVDFCNELSRFIGLYTEQQKCVLAGMTLVSMDKDLDGDMLSCLSEFDRHSRCMMEMFLSGYNIISEFQVINQPYQVSFSPKNEVLALH